MSNYFVNADVGSPELDGSATPVGDGWDVIAGGADIWESSDQFHFVFREISGDFDIRVRIESFTPAHLYSKAGLMIRESQDAASAHVMLVVFSDDEPRNNNLGAYEMQFRAQPGETAVRRSTPWSGLRRRRNSRQFIRTPGCGWRDEGTSSRHMRLPMARPGNCTVKKF